MLKITLKRSTIGRITKHRKIVEALGLRRPGNVVFQPDNPATRGMINEIAFMVDVEEVEEN